MKLAEYLKEVELFGIKLGLHQTTELFTRAAYLTEPGRKPHFIHLAGSNGKGSTGAMLQKALRAAGKNVGFYTSPHLACYNERIRFNGTMISDEELEFEFQQLHPHAEAMRQEGRFVTYFEFTTILALGYFLRKGADFVVWETGMGGRFDSTNFVIPAVSVITNIALEHCQYLGDTLEKIAFEKGGIIKEKVPVFCGCMHEAPRHILQETAEKRSAEFFAVEEPFKLLRKEGMSQFIETPGGEIRLNLAGEMQRKNFTLAYYVLEHLAQRFELDFEAMKEAMKDVLWPGRFQQIKDGSILDGGHNPDGVAALAQGLKEFFPGEKFTFIFASFEDKETAECLKTLLPLAQEFCFMPITSDHRPSCSGDKLKKMVKDIDPEFENIQTFDSLENFLQYKTDCTARKVYCGSLYLLGEYFCATQFEELKNI